MTRVVVKTITLTDDAYGRLKDWKRTPGDSLSKVVLTVVPKRGTLGQMIEDAKELPAASAARLMTMEEAVSWGADPGKLRDKWTSQPRRPF